LVSVSPPVFTSEQKTATPYPVFICHESLPHFGFRPPRGVNTKVPRSWVLFQSAHSKTLCFMSVPPRDPWEKLRIPFLFLSVFEPLFHTSHFFFCHRELSSLSNADDLLSPAIIPDRPPPPPPPPPSQPPPRLIFTFAPVLHSTPADGRCHLPPDFCVFFGLSKCLSSPSLGRR